MPSTPQKEPSLQEVRSILDSARKELEIINSNIANLESQLAAQKIQRDRVQNTLSEYGSLLSPIQRIPYHVLETIFLGCLPAHRNPLMIATEAPMLLTSICRQWRETALLCPRLWAQIHIVFSNEDILWRQSGIADWDQKIDIDKTLLKLCNTIEQWLSRAGSCPLSISFKYWKFDTRHDWVGDRLLKGQSKITLELASVLGKFADSVVDLQIIIPYDLYCLLQDVIPVSELKSLRSLRINLWNHVTRVKFLDGKIATAPNLQRLAIHDESMLITPSLLPASLTDISCHRILTLAQLVSILTSCPNLEQLLATFNADGAPETNPNANRTIPLPKLRVLHLTDDAVRREVIGDFYERIDAPRLEWLDYCATHRQPNESERPHLVALLQTSPGLKKLNLDIPGDTRESLRRILESSSSITHLVMGPEKIPRTAEYVPYYYGDPNNRLKWKSGGSWKFDEIFCPQETSHALLPNLTTLEICIGEPIDVTAESILQFVGGRIDPSSSETKFATLKRVQLFCSEESDVAEEIRRKAQAYGVDLMIDVELKRFVEGPPKEREYPTAHPSGAIEAKIDRTWLSLANEDLNQITSFC